MMILSTFLFVAVVLIVYIFFFKSPPSKEAEQVKEFQKTLKLISRLIILPENEQPTLATVSDASKLKDQPFFANAKTGDKVLIYANSKKAILYNPETDKIVEVSSLNLSTNNSK